jgi:ElaB/YqjD/DUF883 family membrane-anchored ribosome-binding protein
MKTSTQPEHADSTVHATQNCDRSKEKLLADLKMVVADAETLIKEAAAASNEGFASLRARFETRLVEAKAQVVRAQAAAGEKTRHAADAAQAYVKQNPWQSAGVSVAAGAILGFCLGRRVTGPDQDVSTK